MILSGNTAMKILQASAFALALSFPAQALELGGKDLGVSIDRKSGGLGVGVSAGGAGGLKAGLGVETGNGISADAKASLGGSRGVSAGLDANVGGQRPVSARAGIGVGGPSGIGVDIGVGIPAANAPGTGRLGPTTPSLGKVPSIISNMSPSEVRVLRKRCVSVLGNPGGYDAGLAQLCKLLEMAKL